MPTTLTKPHIAFGAGVAGLLLLLCLATPVNMDEFVGYHLLACSHFPNAALHVFREPCNGAYDLTILGHQLPLRSYRFIGFTADWFYRPFYYVWPHYLSARLLGILPLVGLAWVLRTGTRISGIAALSLSALFFPVAFQLITAPVAYQFLVIASIPFAFVWLVSQSSRRQVLGAVALGLALFVAIDQKAIFLLTVPGIALCTLGLLQERQRLASRQDLRSLGRVIWVSGGVALASCAVLFSATMHGGETYFSYLLGKGDSIGVLALEEQLTHFVSQFAPYFFNLENFSHRVYGTDHTVSLLSMLIWGLVLASITLWLVRMWRAGEIRRRPFLLSCLFAFGLVLWSINRVRGSWAGHHLILTFPFLCLALAVAHRDVFSQQGKRIFLGLFIAANLGLGIKALSRQPAPHDDPSKLAVHRMLDDPALSRKYIYVVVDWGMYYLQALYGPRDQLVTYIEPLAQPSEVEAVLALGAKQNKQPLFILLHPSAMRMPLVRQYVPTLHRIGVPGTGVDAVWQVWVP